ncbi:MAG: hypothetical protein ABI767_00890 [Rhodanobacter sp.]
MHPEPGFYRSLWGDLVVLIRKLVFGGALLCAMGSFIASAHAKANLPVEAGAVSVPHCGAHQLDGIAAAAEAAPHRQFVHPVLSYPAGEVPDHWGISFTLMVDVAGRVVCQVREEGDFGQSRALNARRRQMLRAMSAWRYLPFQVDGKAAPSSSASLSQSSAFHGCIVHGPMCRSTR